MWIGSNFHTMNRDKGISISRFASRAFFFRYSDYPRSDTKSLQVGCLDNKGRWAVNSKGVKVGIVITSPNEHYVETRSIRLDYAYPTIKQNMKSS